MDINKLYSELNRIFNGNYYHDKVTKVGDNKIELILDGGKKPCKIIITHGEMLTQMLYSDYSTYNWRMNNVVDVINQIEKDEEDSRSYARSI